MVALVVGGLGLATGVLPGGGPLAVTLVPAALRRRPDRAVAAARAAAHRRRPRRAAPRRAGRRGRPRGARPPAPATRACSARSVVGRRHRRPGGLLRGLRRAALGRLLVFAYFVGMLANTLPLPGGIGGVDGGMVAALAAFGVDPGLALLAVLAYRGFAFWLPIIPGADLLPRAAADRRPLGAPRTPRVRPAAR